MEKQQLLDIKSHSRNHKQLRLGASMYVPLTHEVPTIVAIANAQKYPFLRSVIFDTEDSVGENQIALAMKNLKESLPQFEPSLTLQRFVRVRNPRIFREIVLTFDGVPNLNGFVFPKFTADNLEQFFSSISDNDHYDLMPILETREVFDKEEMKKLRNILLDDPRTFERIICLRIGGNDLFNCLRIRRNPLKTIYDTAVGPIIAMLSGIFIPYGIGLSAPVFEALNQYDVLQKELELDRDHGLFSKTAIHPNQVPLIEASYAVNAHDYEEAIQILSPNALAVFQMNTGRMCEPATHQLWAQDIINRAELYGICDRHLENTIKIEREIA